MLKPVLWYSGFLPKRSAEESDTETMDIIIVCDDLFGLEIYSVLEQINIWNVRENGKEKYNILGYISDCEAPFGNVRHSIARLGSIGSWRPMGDEQYVLGIKMPTRKKETVACLKHVGCSFATVYTPWMITVIDEIEIGEGSFVAANSIKSGMKIGKFATLIASMHSSHAIGDYSTVLRFSNVTGNVGKEAYLGNHVYTHLGVFVGDESYIADGSIVVKDVKPGMSVSGVPARKIKQRKE